MFKELPNSKVLKDGSEASKRLREYLETADLELIESWVSQVLQSGSDGRVLQDIVNALGMRLGFNVEYGLYQGRQGSIGFDGYWWLPGLNLIVECKTTDAYRISTDTLVKYANELEHDRGLVSTPDILIVVGRVDTGDIEAQIRGSRRDDSIRVIGVESLLDLTRAMAALAGGPATEKLRQSLIPQDFTRLDNLSRLVSEVVYETRQMLSMEVAGETEFTDVGLPKVKTETDVVREAVLAMVSAEIGSLTPVVGTQNWFLSQQSDCRNVLFMTSKKYNRKDQQFWYSLPKKWVASIGEDGGVLLLHREGDRGFYKIPWDSLKGWIKGFNEIPDRKRAMWHIGVRDTDGRVEMLLPRLATQQDMQHFYEELAGQC